MSRAEQEAHKREAQKWCQARYHGGYKVFENAQCKLAPNHTTEHRTWRRHTEEDGALLLVWPNREQGTDA